MLYVGKLVILWQITCVLMMEKLRFQNGWFLSKRGKIPWIKSEIHKNVLYGAQTDMAVKKKNRPLTEPPYMKSLSAEENDFLAIKKPSP